MQGIRLFENSDFGKIRVQLDEEGNPWFAGKDIAQSLGYKDTSSAVRVHVDSDDRKMVQLADFQEGGETPTSSVQLGSKIVIINESGVYALIFGSKLDRAKEFKNWVTKEVLPALRKTGEYKLQESLPSYQIEDPIKRAERWVEEEKKRQQLELENKAMAPKAVYFDKLVDRKLLTGFRDTSKELGFKEKWFIKQLIDGGYVFRDKKGKLMPYSNDQVRELFEVKDTTNDKTGYAGVQTLITPKGKETFRLLLTEKAIEEGALRNDYKRKGREDDK